MKALYRFPWLNIGIIFLVTAFFLSLIPGLRFDNDVFSFMPEDHPERIALDEVGEQYASYLILDVVIVNPYGSILEAPGVQAVRAMTEELESIPGVISVDSLANVDYISGADGSLTVMPISENAEGRSLSGREIRRRIRRWDIYDDLLVSDDGRATQIAASLDIHLEAPERESAYNSVREAVERFVPAGYEFAIAGIPATSVQISKNMRADLALLIPFVAALVVLILAWSFRRLGGVLLPLLNVLLSTIWTLGLMSMTDTPITVLGSIIPILMIAVGSAYGIHLVSRFYEDTASGTFNRARRLDLAVESVRSVGLPIAMAALTTMAGFGALMVSTVGPMKVFGAFTAFGVGTALLIALILIPSLLIVSPYRNRSGGAKRIHGRSMDALAAFVVRRPIAVLAAAAALTTLSITFIPRLNIDNDLTAYFKEGTEVREAERMVRERFAGTNSFSILISGDHAGSLTDPGVLLFMEGLRDRILDQFPEVGKVVTYGDFIKRINQVLHEDDPGHLSLASAPDAPAPGSAENSHADIDGFGLPGAGPGVERLDDEWANSDWADGSFDGSSADFADDSFLGEASTASAFLMEHAAMPAPESGTASMAAAAPLASAESSALMNILWEAYLAEPEDVMGELARLTNHEGVDFYEIPSDPAKYGLSGPEDLNDLIAQFLLLYSGSLSDWSNEALEPSTARMNVQIHETGTRYVDGMRPVIQEYADRFLPEGYSLEIVGSATVQSVLTRLIVDSMLMSIFLSVVLVFVIVSLTYRSVVAGLLGIIPLGITVLVNFGVMGITGIRLDISTAMVGSIAIGIGIDYCIHFLSSYSGHWKDGRGSAEVTRLAMASSGRAILVNAVSVAAGFAVLLFSRFNPLMYLGVLIVLTMGVSSLTSLTVLPALLNLLEPGFLRRNRHEEQTKELIA